MAAEKWQRRYVHQFQVYPSTVLAHGIPMASHVQMHAVNSPCQTTYLAQILHARSGIQITATKVILPVSILPVSVLTAAAQHVYCVAGVRRAVKARGTLLSEDHRYTCHCRQRSY